MKTYAEQIADLNATRKAKAERMKSIMDKAAEQARTLDTGEQEEFDTLKGEITQVDKSIGNLRDLEAMEKADEATAKPADDADKRKGAVSTVRSHVEVKNTEKLEPGISFARMARVKALAHIGLLNTKEEVEVAKRVYPNDEKLIASLTQKTAVNAATTLTGNDAWAGNLITDGGVAFADFVEYLRPRTLLGRIGDRLRRLPFDTPVLIQGTGGTAAWSKEGTAKPLTEWTYTRTKLQPLKVAAIAAATKETLMRASVAADTLLRDELARAVGATLDTTFISDDAAVTDESPAGILAGVGALTLSGGTDADSVRCDVESYLTAFADNNLSLQGAFWVMPERIAIALSLMQNPLGQSAFPGVNFEGGTFFGLPAFVTSYAETDSVGSTVALIKGDEIFLGDEGGIQVSMSDQASLVMDNAPQGTMNSTTPTPAQVVSLWQTNSVAFLVERFMNWQRRRTQAVAWGKVSWSACSSS